MKGDVIKTIGMVALIWGIIGLVYFSIIWLPILLCRSPEPKQSEPMVVDSIVIETAAHIPVENFPDATRVWFDTETDRAIYIKNDYRPFTKVNSGMWVTFGDYTGMVQSHDNQGFIVLLDGALASYGMSGSYVYCDNACVGFVSKAISTTEVYVVYF